jgi:ribose 5-phosphate isomerase A
VSDGSVTSVEALKRAASAEALKHVESGMLLGLGTGSTMAHFLELLADRLSGGELADIVGVPTSERTAQACRGLGIPLSSLAETPRLDLAIDGADEVDPSLDLIKGLGGALLREKMVVQAAASFIVIADERKLVRRLGERSPLPVEVVPFGWQSHVGVLEGLGARPVLRESAPGEAYRTDNGNLILDAHFADGIQDPAGLERTLSLRAGVVDTGLFLDMARLAVIATSTGTRMMERP